MTRKLLLAAIVAAIGVITLFAQLPIPAPGQNDGQRGQRGGQRGGAPATPATPPRPMVVAPLATVSPEVTGPGKFFETLMTLKPTDDLAHFEIGRAHV